MVDLKEGFAPPFRIEDRADVPVTDADSLDGALDPLGSVMGTYIHGLFHNGGLRDAMLRELARRKGVTLSDASSGLDLDREFDKLADWVRSSVDMELVYRISGLNREYGAAGARV